MLAPGCIRGEINAIARVLFTPSLPIRDARICSHDNEEEVHQNDLLPAEHRLLAEWFELFVNSQLSVDSRQKDALRDLSSRYRAAIKRATKQLEAESNGHTSTSLAQARAEDCAILLQRYEIANAVWHVAEVALLQGSANDAKSSSASAVALIQCLRENFMTVVDEVMLLRILGPLRSPAAATSAALEREVWDVVAKLTVEGSPSDAGKLLRLLAQLKRDSNMEAFAQLLIAFPPFSTGAAGEGAAAYASSWSAWKAQAVSFRRQSAGMLNNEPVWDALLDVVSGAIWSSSPSALSNDGFSSSQPRGLQRLPISPGGIVSAAVNDPEQEFPYAEWPYICLCSVLYGGGSSTQQSPSTLNRTSIAKAVGDAMRLGGEHIDDVDLDSDIDAQIASGVIDADAAADVQRQRLLASLVRTLEGDASAPLRFLPSCDLFPAAAHLADLLWHAGHLDAPALWGQWNAPARAHFLLQYANTLAASSASLTRAAVSYAAAAMPENVLAFSGVPAATLQAIAHASAASATSSSAIVAALLSAEVSSLTPQLRKAKLMLMTGSSRAAVEVMDALLLQVPVSNDSDASSAMALARRADRPAVAAAIGSKWAMACLDGSNGDAAVPGNALAWFVRLHNLAGVQAVARHLQAHADAAIDSIIRIASNHGAAGPVDWRTLDAALQSALQAVTRTIDAPLATLGHTAIPEVAHGSGAAQQSDHGMDTDGVSRTTNPRLSNSDILEPYVERCHALRVLLLHRRMLDNLHTAVAAVASSATASASSMQVPEGAASYFRAAATDITTLCSAAHGAAPLVDSGVFRRLLRLSYACGLFSAGVLMYGSSLSDAVNGYQLAGPGATSSTAASPLALSLTPVTPSAHLRALMDRLDLTDALPGVYESGNDEHHIAGHAAAASSAAGNGAGPLSPQEIVEIRMAIGKCLARATLLGSF